MNRTVLTSLATVTLVTAVAVGLVLTAGSARPWAKGGTPAQRHGARSHASWIGPASFAELVRGADFAGAATVVRVETGEPLPTPSAADAAPLPTQVVTLRVEEQWKGDAVGRIRLFKTGNDTVWITDDPPYEPGQVYMLLATRRAEDGLLIPFGPEGRIEIRDGRASSLTDSPTAAVLDGQSIEAVAATIREAMR
ncbi:hypothetical protein [Patulibacter defluvii]|uniref:hypothetical protein n=1 Tax=Patulibacter defluvii TaxID=3095358 RepID=UPI002A75DE4A|nr:hypothetical protein [Patulibacter sp. DM4]